MIRECIFKDYRGDCCYISSIESINNRVVIVHFSDGSFTKCVSESEKSFDLYTGIAFCLFKKHLGKDGHKAFNNLMKNAMAIIDRQKKEAEENEKRKEIKAIKDRKMKLKIAAKKLKKREEAIDIQKEGYLRAMREIRREQDDE